MRRALMVAIGALSVAASCTPTTGGSHPTGPQPPGILSFTAPGAPFSSPALVPLAWSVYDADGDALSCRIDRDGDGIWDDVLPHCELAGSRVHAEAIGTHVAALEVSDADHPPVVGHVTYTVTAGPIEPFNIDLRPVSPLSPTVQPAFDAAKAYWQSAIVSGVPAQSVTLSAGQCLAGAAPFSGSIDDLMIDVEVHPIDGVDGILGQAGPCVVSSGDHLARTGVMEFDSADIAGMISDGTLGRVIMHEMGHVLGFGTLWNLGRSMLTGAGGADPRFTGPRGVAEWSALGGLSSVPVENSGGEGTADSHWRESTFGNELMTGYIQLGLNPLAAASIASLGDLGYHVDTSVADPYSLPGSALRSRPPHHTVEGVMLRPPISVQ